MQQQHLTSSIQKIKAGDFLLEGSDETNFIFEVSADFENSQEPISFRFEAIKFCKIESEIFENNLVMLDSILPKIIGYLMIASLDKTDSSVAHLTSLLESSNPLGEYTKGIPTFYPYKIKRFVYGLAYGMKPNEVWSGEPDTRIQHIIEQAGSESLQFNIYNRNQFEDYLFHNTKLETASSTRHEFGKIYSENGKAYIKLNLQIRFL